MKYISMLVWLSVTALAPGADELRADTDVSATLLDGSRYSSHREDSGRPLLLKFWATWCVACLQEMPAYIQLHEEYGKQVRFLAVNVAVSDPLDRVRKTVNHYKLEMPVAYDQSGELWDRFGIVGTPSYVLLDADGRGLHRSYAHDEGLISRLDQAIGNHTQQDAPTVTEKPGEDASRSTTILHDIDGKAVSISPDEKEVLIGYHFATWCASYVSESYPELSTRCREFDKQIQALLAMDFPDTRLIGFISAYSTSAASAVKFRDARNISHPLVFDEENAYDRFFGSRDFPHITVVAGSGEVLYSGSQVPANIDHIVRSAIRTAQ